jgi:hypothetical protein
MQEAKALRDEYTRTIDPARALVARRRQKEEGRMMNEGPATGSGPAEIELMWQTAPPRMPIPPPAG